MKSWLITLLVIISLILLPSPVSPQAEQTAGGPPVSQPLIREGTLAVRLAEAFGLGKTADETEAESLLGTAGIAPRNGWIADYPVTPDIVGELRASVADASDTGRLTTDKERALKAFDDVIAEHQLAVTPDTSGTGAEPEPETDAQDMTVINNYYYNEGPPVVTYYAPPAAYSYLYSWVPYPFWWWDHWFPGFYVLVDFHKVVVVHKHREVISNHVFDRREKRFYSVDPATRAHGGRFMAFERPKGFRPSAVRSGVGAGSGRSVHGERPFAPSREVRGSTGRSVGVERRPSQALQSGRAIAPSPQPVLPSAPSYRRGGYGAAVQPFQRPSVRGGSTRSLPEVRQSVPHSSSGGRIFTAPVGRAGIERQPGPRSFSQPLGGGRIPFSGRSR